MVHQVLSKLAATDLFGQPWHRWLTLRDLCEMFLLAEHGRLGWQKVSGYTLRALAEAAVSRYKRIIGDTLRSRTDGRQATEVTIAVGVLNRMLELGRPEFVRVA